jgi:hypothetical protein
MSRRGYPQRDQELEPERLDSILGAAFSTGATRAPAGCQQLVSPVRAAAVQRASDLPVDGFWLERRVLLGAIMSIPASTSAARSVWDKTCSPSNAPSELGELAELILFGRSGPRCYKERLGRSLFGVASMRTHYLFGSLTFGVTVMATATISCALAGPPRATSPGR